MEVDYCVEALPSSGKPRFVNKEDVVPPKDLNDLIAQLHQVFSRDEVNVEYVHELLSSYKSNPDDWKKFAKFDPHRYTRNLVDEGNGKFNLIVLCWNESQGSSIHDHASSHCFMKILGGKLQEQLYSWPDTDGGQMALIGVNTYDTDGVAYIHDKIGLHRVENPSNTDVAVSLHLYSPPFDMCQCFDERTGRCTSARVTFWSKYGERTPYQAQRFRQTPGCLKVGGTKPGCRAGSAGGTSGPCACIRKGISNWPWCTAADVHAMLSRDDEHNMAEDEDALVACPCGDGSGFVRGMYIQDMDEEDALYYRDLCLAL